MVNLAGMHDGLKGWILVRCHALSSTTGSPIWSGCDLASTSG